jgi:hypothetical protein
VFARQTTASIPPVLTRSCAQRKRKKAWIINTTIFNEAAYQKRGPCGAMRRLIDEFYLNYPGIQTVEHEFYYGVNMADEGTRQAYLERAHRLGKEFPQRGAAPRPPALRRACHSCRPPAW